MTPTTFRHPGGRNPAGGERQVWRGILFGGGGDYDDLRGGILRDPAGRPRTEVIQGNYQDYFQLGSERQRGGDLARPVPAGRRTRATCAAILSDPVERACRRHDRGN